MNSLRNSNKKKSTLHNGEKNQDNTNKPSPNDIISPTAGQWITEGINPNKVTKKGSQKSNK
ncbi:hypothetical protein ISS30_00025 [bacterium]|nr:hypothetical protein [FCB group bacterium]MBL7190055.1 hypothetical protein [bacterium]